jgi:hypothetical protein
MAIVLTYWSLPEEEEAFLKYLKTWDIYAYPPQTFPKASEVKPIPMDEVLRMNPSQVSFGPKQLLSDRDVAPRDVVDEVQHFGVSAMHSQTITYSRPFFRRDGTLGQSNLCVYWKYPLPDLSGFVEKDPDFIKWAKVVLSWSGKRAREKLLLNGYPYPATTKVKEMVEQNKLKLGF